MKQVWLTVHSLKGFEANAGKFSQRDIRLFFLTLFDSENCISQTFALLKKTWHRNWRNAQFTWTEQSDAVGSVQIFI